MSIVIFFGRNGLNNVDEIDEWRDELVYANLILEYAYLKRQLSPKMREF